MNRVTMTLGLCRRIGVGLLAGLWLLGPARAQAAADDERQRAVQEATRAAQAGPLELPLAAQAKLKLPAGMQFVPQPQAGRLLVAMGNPGEDPNLHGLVFPSQRAGWFVTVRFEPAGFVKDDDARDWKPDELLQSYREGTEAANGERARRGLPQLEILGWAQPPAYDAAAHRLVWAMSTRHKGDAPDAPQGVNHNTYVLGREGYFMLNLVTGLKDLPAHLPQAQLLLSALAFDEGKRYADFNAGTDRVAEYGLAALVVGAAAKKFGLLAAAGLFVAKFGKLLLVGAALLGGIAVNLFKRKPAGAGPA
jgi:uncharacterized membrane-anchored protein